VHLVRLLSVGLGAATVWLTWRIARCLWPGNEPVPLLAATLTAFNPMFLFISASVNNDNLAAPLAAAAMLVLLSALQRGQRAGDGLWLGVLLGLGALTKLSVLALLPIAAVALTWDAWRRRAWRAWLFNAVLIAACMALIAGWWYWRNWTLYGEPTGASRMLDIAGRRDEPLTLPGLWAEFEGFRISYWALFGGVSILADRWIYRVLDGLALLAGLGVIVAGISIAKSANRQNGKSANQQTPAPASRSPGSPVLAGGPGGQVRVGKSAVLRPSSFVLATPYFLLLVWTLLVFFSLIRWTAQTYASQGRLMFVAIAGISTLLAAGLAALTPTRWRWAMTGLVGGGLLLLSAISPFRYILPAYTRPPLMTEADLPAGIQRTDWEINGEIRLLGYRLERPAVHPAETLPVTVYWQALVPMATDYSVFVHLLGRDRAVVGQVNTYPGLGTWPTSHLQPGDVLADTYYVPVDPHAEAPSLLRVHVGMYRYNEPGRPGLPTTNARGEPIEPWLATAKLAPWDWPQAAPAKSLQVRFGEMINLVGYTLGDNLTLYWQASGRPAADYTVFIQVWDDNGQVAGFDGPTLRGDYPTSWWEAGETVVDVHALSVQDDRFRQSLASGRYRVLIGLYRLDTGERLPAVGPDGPLPDYAVALVWTGGGK
jgi:hypothetical protein